MSSKSFYSITGTVFLVIAVGHLLRILNGWEAVIGSFTIPVWASWIAVILAGYLSYQGLKKKG